MSASQYRGSKSSRSESVKNGIGNPVRRIMSEDIVADSSRFALNQTSSRFYTLSQFSRSRGVVDVTPPEDVARVSYHARARLQFIGGCQ
jgi:hypothetical protein